MKKTIGLSTTVKIADYNATDGTAHSIKLISQIEFDVTEENIKAKTEEMWLLTYEDIEDQKLLLQKEVAQRPKEQVESKGDGKVKDPTKGASDKQKKMIFGMLISRLNDKAEVYKYVIEKTGKKLAELTMGDVDMIVKENKVSNVVEDVVCENEHCKAPITSKKIVEYSKKNFNQVLCYKCQQEAKGA